MKVYLIFSGRSYEESVLMFVVSTEAEAKRVTAAFEAECEKDIADGEAFGGHYWYYQEEEVHERIEV